jgi:class 3 adenylate cyclase
VDVNRRLAAILVADVAGYSRLMGDDEAATVRTLTEYREIFIELTMRHGGRVVDTSGDSVLAVFDSPVEAVDCATEIQKALHRRNRQLAEHRRMQFRIGINLGDVISREDGSVYGDGVNIAARLEGLAHPGSLCVSGAIYDQVEGKLQHSFVLAGEHSVKNIAKPVRAYHVAIDAPTAQIERGPGRAIEAIQATDAQASALARQPWSWTSNRATHFAAATALLIAVAIGLAVWISSRTVSDRALAPMRLATIDLTGHPYPRRQASWFALSNDGLLVYSIEGSSGPMMTKRLDAPGLQPLDGTDGGDSPFISLDGQMLGFERGGEMYVASSSGGSAMPVKGASILAWGGRPAWTADHRIIYTSNSGGLAIVRPGGQSLEQLTAPPKGTRHLSPLVLPGGGIVLFTEIAGTVADARVLAISLDDHQIKTVVSGGANTPQYADGFVFYCRPDGTLMAAPFDPAKIEITGDTRSLAQRVDRSRFGVAHYAAAPGVLLYAPFAQTRLVEMDTRGGVTALTEDGRWHMPRYSPDGSRIVFDRVTSSGADRDIWTLSLLDKALSRVTRIGDAHDASWLPNGTEVSFLSFSASGGPLMIAAADGGSEPRGVRLTPVVGPFPAGQLLNPGVWLPDGSAYLGGVVMSPGNSNIWRFPRAGSPPSELVGGPFDEHSPSVSADGRWLAYQSNETGRSEVYVRGISEPQGRLQVSTSGATAPVWDKRTTTLYYLETDAARMHLMAASLRTTPTLAVIGRRLILPDVRLEEAENHPQYDVDRSGTKFVLPESNLNVGLGAIFNVATSLSLAHGFRK